MIQKRERRSQARWRRAGHSTDRASGAGSVVQDEVSWCCSMPVAVTWDRRVLKVTKAAGLGSATDAAWACLITPARWAMRARPHSTASTVPPLAVPYVSAPHAPPADRPSRLTVFTCLRLILARSAALPPARRAAAVYLSSRLVTVAFVFSYSARGPSTAAVL